MALDNPSNRLTSEELRIEWFPRVDSAAAAIHIQHLYFDGAVDGGTFKLWVNGEITASITWNATIATFLASINTALDNLANLAAGDIVATGASDADITLTAAAAGYFRILIHEDSLTQTVANTNEKLQTDVTQQGSQQYVLTAQASAFNWEGQGELVDMTAISEFNRTEVPVALAVNFDISLFKALEEWEHSLYPTTFGTLRVFPQGKIVGREYFQFRAVIETASEDYPDHEKIEKEISGQRQGDWHVPPNTIWRG